jgi:hypothetical protein
MNYPISVNLACVCLLCGGLVCTPGHAHDHRDPASPPAPYRATVVISSSGGAMLTGQRVTIKPGGGG